MTEKEQIGHFSDDLQALVNRYRKEYDLSYASVIGTLHMMMHTLCEEDVKPEE